jgi:hypothetical protein
VGAGPSVTECGLGRARGKGSVWAARYPLPEPEAWSMDNCELGDHGVPRGQEDERVVSTAQAARILDVTPGRVLQLARAGTGELCLTEEAERTARLIARRSSLAAIRAARPRLPCQPVVIVRSSRRAPLGQRRRRSRSRAQARAPGSEDDGSESDLAGCPRRQPSAWPPPRAEAAA